MGKGGEPGSPDPLAKYREWVAFVQKDMGIKGGPLTNTFAAYFRNIAKKQKPDASQDELNDIAKKIYNDDKKAGKLRDIFEKVRASAEKKRADKKQQKQAAKQAAKASS